MLDVTFETADALEIQADFWNTLSDLDLIVSNPPYIPENEKAELPANVLDFEPHLALFVENNSPIIFYERIAELAQQKLKSGGLLYFELHYLYSTKVIAYLEKIGFQQIEVRKDLQGKNRMLKAVK